VDMFEHPNWTERVFKLMGYPSGKTWVEDAVSQADQLYAQRFEKANVTKAVEVLDKAVAADGYEALWRLARCYWFLGDRATGKEKLTLFEKGKSYAEQAVKTKDNGVEGHYWMVPGFPISIGNKKKAQEEAVLATTGDSKATDHWLHLGQIASDNKDFATAKTALQKVLTLPDDPEDPEASRKDKAAAKDELKKIEGKK
jgi:tetratricopeptide (TPR) repeat protein